MVRLSGALIGIYPIVAHIGIWASYPRLAVSYLVGLLLFLLLYPPRFLKLKNILVSIILLASIIYLFTVDMDIMLIYLPPILIPAVLMIVFIQSLQKDRIPLITKFALKTEVILDSEHMLYTRKVTILWASVFAFMVLEAIGLAVWSSQDVWSWVTHIGNYFLIALILIIEFIYRQQRFETKDSSFKNFVIQIVRHRWK